MFLLNHLPLFPRVFLQYHLCPASIVYRSIPKLALWLVQSSLLFFHEAHQPLD